MASLGGRNTQSDQIVRAARVVLQVLILTLTIHLEVGTCCYLLHGLLGTQYPLVDALRSQFVDAIEEYVSLFAMQTSTTHRCTALSYDIFFIIGTYLNACVKALEKDFVQCNNLLFLPRPEP